MIQIKIKILLNEELQNYNPIIKALTQITSTINNRSLTYRFLDHSFLPSSFALLSSTLIKFQLQITQTIALHIMKKFFVLYSLKQKLIPTLYKTKATVAKHVRINSSLKFQEFDSEEQAKTFIDKLSIGITAKQNPFLTENEVNDILKTITIQPNNNQKQSSNEEKTLSKETVHRISRNQNMEGKKSSWIILPNGHALRHEADQQKQDGTYSSLRANQDPSALVQQSESTSPTQQFTTEGLTQQIHFGPGQLKRSSQQNKYWVLWNNKDFSQIETGKKQLELGRFLFEIQKQHSVEWIKGNITTKSFTTKRESIKWAEHLNDKRKAFVNRLKAQKLIQQTNNQTTLQNQIKQNQTQKFSTDGQPSELTAESVAEVKNQDQQTQSEQQIQVSKAHEPQAPLKLLKYEDIEPLEIKPLEMEKLKQDQSTSKIESKKKLNIEATFERIRWAKEMIKEDNLVTDKEEIGHLNEMKNEILPQQISQQDSNHSGQQDLKHEQPISQQPISEESTQVEQKKKELQAASQHLHLKVQNQEQKSQIKIMSEWKETANEQSPAPTELQLQVQKITLQPLQQTTAQTTTSQPEQTSEQPDQKIMPIQSQILSSAYQVPSKRAEQKQQDFGMRKQPLFRKEPSSFSNVHPFNRSFVRESILKNLLDWETTKNHNISQGNHENLQAAQQQQYILHPRISIRQSPGLATASFMVRSSSTDSPIKQQRLTLGQTKKQQANLLALAFCLSTIYRLNSKNKIKVHLGKQMSNVLNFDHKLDRKVLQAKRFLQQIERKLEGRVEYVV